jgi:hypothetical protein
LSQNPLYQRIISEELGIYGSLFHVPLITYLKNIILDGFNLFMFIVFFVFISHFEFINLGDWNNGRGRLGVGRREFSTGRDVNSAAQSGVDKNIILTVNDVSINQENFENKILEVLLVAMNKYLTLDFTKLSENINGEDCLNIRNVRLSFYYFGNEEMNNKEILNELKK